MHMTDALKRIVNAAAGHIHNDILDGSVMILWIDNIGCPELPGQVELARIDVNGNDALCLGHAGADDDG